jgi:CRP/FNR family cyclic AMP-dependent transcriptional regulator
VDTDTAPHDFANLPMLARLHPDDHERLRAASWTRRYAKGQILCTENDPADHLLILEDGLVKAGRHTASGREVILAVHAPLVAFDKAELLTDGRHLATITALTAVTIRYLPGPVFTDLVEREPSVRHRVLATMASTLRTRTQQLTDIATLDVAGRLAKWLLGRATIERVEGNSVLITRLTTPQSDLAAELGSTRVTVNRVLHGFRDAGLIALQPGHVVLLDPDRLTALYDDAAARSGHLPAPRSQPAETGPARPKAQEDRTSAPSPPTWPAQ